MPVSKPSKPKGCYNCMKRRIICDRTEPRCNKCHKKGLECTGFGIRYRFNDGVASRGHLKGKKQPTPTSDNQSSVWKEAILSQPKHLIWLNERFPVSPVKQGASDSSMISWLNIEDFGNDNSGSVESTAFEVDRTECPLVFYEPIELLDSKTRFLFSHFSTHVSPAMIMFDGETNGYRHEILPFGVCNDVVQRSICVAAALHLAPRMPELRVSAEAGRVAIIKKLKENLDRRGPSDVFAETTWVTILLLIVADLVTGNEDVLILYRMLQSCVKGRPAGLETPLTRFLMYQSQIIEFFAHPILSENDGVQRLSQESQPLISIIEKGYDAPPSANLFVLLYNEAYRQARDIYLLRARPTSWPTNESNMVRLLQQLKSLLFDLDPTTEGAHTLVWPYFIAAAESSDESSRQFFYARLEHIWTTTGYNNVRVALMELKRIWGMQPFQRWTSLVPEIATVIM